MVKQKNPASSSLMVTPGLWTLAILTQWDNSVFKDCIQMKTPAERGEFSSYQNYLEGYIDTMGVGLGCSRLGCW